jgi:hypothetical protein
LKARSVSRSRLLRAGRLELVHLTAEQMSSVQAFLYGVPEGTVIDICGALSLNYSERSIIAITAFVGWDSQCRVHLCINAYSKCVSTYRRTFPLKCICMLLTKAMRD